MTVAASAILGQLLRADLLQFAVSLVEHPVVNGKAKITGRMRSDVLAYLRQHPQFLKSPVALHHGDDVGEPRTEFRSIGGAFGDDGPFKDWSLQVSVNTEDWRFYADLDEHNPLQSKKHLVKHNVEEVAWPRVQSWLARRIPRWLKKRP